MCWLLYHSNTSAFWCHMLPCHSKHVSLKACCSTVYRSIGNSVDHTVLCRSSVVCEGHKGCLHNILYEKAMVLSLLGDCNRVDLHDCMARWSSSVVCEGHMGCLHNILYEKAMVLSLLGDCNRVDLHDCMARRSSTIVGEEHMDCFHSTLYEKAMSFLLVDGCNILVSLDHIVPPHSKIFLAAWGVACYCSRFLPWSCIYSIHSMHNQVSLDKLGWGNRHL